MKISFPDIELALRNEESYFKLGQTVEDAFPYLKQEKANLGAQFAGPLSVMQAATRWTWLAVLSGTKAEVIRDVLAQLVHRSIIASRVAGGAYLRGEHDLFLMLVSVLSGNLELMQTAAETVSMAQRGEQGYQFFQAWTGILRARVMRSAEEEATQLAVLLRKRGLSGFQCPSHALAKAFCGRDYTKMRALLRQAFKNSQEAGKASGSIVVEPTGNLTVFLRGRDPNMFWPWAEAGFAKLAWMEGIEIQTDPLWLPDALLKLT